MNADSFTPRFDEQVVEYIPMNADNIREVQINPAYCLTLESALELAGFFNPPPKLLLLPPIAQAPASPYRFNKPVPWLEFANGETRNAGQFAQWWKTPGVPPNMAIVYARADVGIL